MACKHEFIGNAKGVKCSLCGTELTVDEYRKYLKNPNETEPTESVADKEVQPKVAKKSTKKK